jgi:hypothetical protein
MTVSPAVHGGQATRGAGLGRARARIEGLAVLAILAFTGLALWRLSALADPPAPIDWSPCGARGALAILSDGALRVRGALSEARAIISEGPIAFDPRRSVITFHELGTRRVVPAGAALVLAGADGRIAASRVPLIPLHLLESLRGTPAASRCEALRAWLANPQHPRTPLEDPLRRLLGL